MASPLFKVYIGNEYVAACKHAEHAAAVVGASGTGTVRAGHAKRDTLWTEGEEEFSASESWDGAADIILRRLQEKRAQYHAKGAA